MTQANQDTAPTLWRTHKCGQISLEHEGKMVKISGFLHNKRDHGGLLFLDARDASGIIQVLLENQESIYKFAKLKLESVIVIEGKVRKRPDGTINESLTSGNIEIVCSNLQIESEAKQIPFQINSQAADLPNEDLRLQYRFLDLRRKEMADKIKLRSAIISFIRKRMESAGFTEFTTPILTSSSPEGARDFLVPSRLHPGKFYALPQAPQQFKQLIVMSGFEKYFQIAPCFRDEDSRADRSPGEFYQLDIEMAYATQEDIFSTIGPILHAIFKNFTDKEISPTPFRRIPYHESMLKYGTDKPDLRNPLENFDATEVFRDSGFSIFANGINSGKVVRAIHAPDTNDQPRSFFDKMIDFAKSYGAGGLAYIVFEKDGTLKSPIAKLMSQDRIDQIIKISNVKNGDTLFFACEHENLANLIAGEVRKKLGKDLNLIDQSKFEFCWIVDFPFYERDQRTGKIDFSHNPFSMPQGGMEALLSQDPTSIRAFQYDIVCNGIELSSGAIRNHKVEIMYKAFEIAGYTKDEVDTNFGGMVKSFSYGAPPHGGIAPGLDRIVMLLAEVENIREVILFPMNGKAEDLLMNAPCEVSDAQLAEIHIKKVKPIAVPK